MIPAKWPESVWVSILAILESYIRKWSGPTSPAELSPEERDEVRSRIILDIMTGDPGDLSIMHYVFRTARRWRVRGWAGDTESHRDLMRKARAKSRKDARDPGSAESETARNKSPYRGSSADSKQPTPLAILIAAESAERGDLRYVSDRQRKARRRPVRGNPGPITYRVRITGSVGRGLAGYGPTTGRPLYWIGSATCIAFEPIPATFERGEYDKKARRYRDHIPYTGSIPNRMIGKKKADPIPAVESMGILVGESDGRSFVRQPIPAAIPAIPGTELTRKTACPVRAERIAAGDYNGRARVILRG